MSGPLIAVPGRLSRSASALRYAAVVNAQALLDGVVRAGGEPLTVLPRPLTADPMQDPDGASEHVHEVLRWADGVLLPGGGDLDPRRYGQPLRRAEVYDVDEVQDAFDLAVARWALDAGVPLLALCRGAQVVNVALGGTLAQHMDDPHRERLHVVRLEGELATDIFGPSSEVSCFHHQRVDRLAEGLRVAAVSSGCHCTPRNQPGEPGRSKASTVPSCARPATRPAQQGAFDALVAAARAWAAAPRSRRPVRAASSC
jgi:putative glutamine amidotransferase